MIDIDTIQGGLWDHMHLPHSICTHEDTEWPDHMRISTLVSVIMDLNQQEMYIADGLPCRSDYERYKL